MKTTFTLTKKFTIFFFAVAALLTGTATAQTFRIFNPGTEVPTAGASNTNSGFATVQVGLQFQVTQAGAANAIHMYRGTANPGPNVVHLWDIDQPGTPLATETIPADGISGWKTIALTTPVTLSPNVTYIVSAHNPQGIISRSGSGIPGNADITARPGFIIISPTAGTSLAEPTSAGNGVTLANGGVNDMPTGVFAQGDNYWVDLSFTTFAPLPVTLTDFKATTASSNVTLSWKTEFEANNKGFELQRSNNGSTWYEVSFINGVGESNSTKTYSYTDKGLAPGLYHYRLVQKDFDGKTKTSSTVTAEIEGRGKVALLQNAPNPFHSTSKIRFDLPSSQRVRLSVWDISGREIKVLVNGTRESGSHIVTLDAAGLSPQTYYVRLQTEEGTFTQKIVVN